MSVEFDRQAGLHSIPVALGIRGALRLAAACHVVTIACLAALPLVYPSFGWIYWAGVAVIAAMGIVTYLIFAFIERRMTRWAVRGRDMQAHGGG